MCSLLHLANLSNLAKFRQLFNDRLAQISQRLILGFLVTFAFFRTDVDENFSDVHEISREFSYQAQMFRQFSFIHPIRQDLIFRKYLIFRKQVILQLYFIPRAGDRRKLL